MTVLSADTRTSSVPRGSALIVTGWLCHVKHYSLRTYIREMQIGPVKDRADLYSLKRGVVLMASD
jgi:hypothetical protein